MLSNHTRIDTVTPSERDRLFDVWESSVRATHDFLMEHDLQELLPLVREALTLVDPVYCTRDEHGCVVAFMFVHGGKIEMLFVAPSHRGQGAGRALVEHALNALRATAVDVNEQNPQAIGFYRRMGFEVSDPSGTDLQDNDFPILQMTIRRDPARDARYLAIADDGRPSYCATRVNPGVPRSGSNHHSRNGS